MYRRKPSALFVATMTEIYPFPRLYMWWTYILFQCDSSKRASSVFITIYIKYALPLLLTFTAPKSTISIDAPNLVPLYLKLTLYKVSFPNNMQNQNEFPTSTQSLQAEFLSATATYCSPFAW